MPLHIWSRHVAINHLPAPNVTRDLNEVMHWTHMKWATQDRSNLPALDVTRHLISVLMAHEMIHFWRRHFPVLNVKGHFMIFPNLQGCSNHTFVWMVKCCVTFGASKSVNGFLPAWVISCVFKLIFLVKCLFIFGADMWLYTICLLLMWQGI